jgi:hypothetical protein
MKIESIRTIGGLVAVVAGIVAVAGLAIGTMAFIDSSADSKSLIPLATSAFGVISAMVGAFVGIKIGTDQSKGFAKDASEAHAQVGALKTMVPDKEAADKAATEAVQAVRAKPH